MVKNVEVPKKVCDFWGKIQEKFRQIQFLQKKKTHKKINTSYPMFFWLLNPILRSIFPYLVRIFCKLRFKMSIFGQFYRNLGF